MSSLKKKPSTSLKDVVPYELNDEVTVQYEFTFGKDVIKPGTKIKFKNDRGIYRFRLLAHHAGKDVTWIDCFNVATAQWHSFYIESLNGVVKPKRSRRHKAQT